VEDSSCEAESNNADSNRFCHREIIYAADPRPPVSHRSARLEHLFGVAQRRFRHRRA
jgi:hypothetical protein